MVEEWIYVICFVYTICKNDLVLFVMRYFIASNLYLYGS
ncbi:protein of unknown function [Cardinium endosymbiont cEper1 of Encarsia pergandiella]|nr:protein of unknown function [Cardinium endosymbiont cEper1 of Encarsia pergandiella]